MTQPLDPSMTRRAMLRHLAVAAGVAASLPRLGWSSEAPMANAGTASKAAVQYQNHPNGTAACANCANFISGKGHDRAGHCTIVAGAISLQGWCLAYAGNS